MKNLKKLIFVVSAIFATVTVHGAVLVPTGVTATSEYNGGSGDFRAAVRTIDSSGLSGGLHNQNPDPASGGGMWLTDNTQTATITFDLGSVQTINQLVIWNYNERTYNPGNNADYSYRGVKNFSLFADNTLNPTSLIGAYSLARNTMPPATTFGGINDYGMDNTGTAQTIVLSSPVTVLFFCGYQQSHHKWRQLHRPVRSPLRHSSRNQLRGTARPRSGGPHQPPPPINCELGNDREIP